MRAWNRKRVEGEVMATIKRPSRKKGPYKCIYKFSEHVVPGRKVNEADKDRVCGKTTGNNGWNRYYCAAHHRSISKTSN